MRKSLTAVFLALAPVAALTTLAPVAPAHAQQAEVSVSLFYDQLSTHGKWAEHPRWGWVWYPNEVDPDWRPYTRGRWVWTQEYGWYWASNEPFGWATYHYGRWGYDERYGWVWVPGERWAPSWVAFRYSDRHVGWAPLPPETLQITGSVTFDDAVVTASYYQPRWVFVESRHFVDADIRARAVPVERNVTFIRETRNVTNITVQNNVFVNRSFEPQRIRAVVGRDIPTVRVNRVNDVNRLDIRQRNQTNLTTINIYNPRVRVERERQPPERARARDNDRPRVSIRPELVRPEDRRDRGDRPGDRDRTAPGAPPSTTPGTPSRPGTETDRNRATPGQPQQRRDERGTERRDDTPSRTQPDRRGATPGTPAQPPRTAPGAPPSREGTTPQQRQDDRRGQRPGQTPPRTDDDKRGATPATPAQPPRTSPGAPPSRGTQDDKRGATPATPAQPPRATPGAPPSRGQPDQKRGATPATPAQPPRVAPGAPPSRQAPPQQGQPQRGQPAKPGKESDKEDKSRGPSR